MKLGLAARRSCLGAPSAVHEGSGVGCHSSVPPHTACRAAVNSAQSSAPSPSRSYLSMAWVSSSSLHSPRASRWRSAACWSSERERWPLPSMSACANTVAANWVATREGAGEGEEAEGRLVPPPIDRGQNKPTMCGL
eukprot:scaffold234653_cov28-Tisochrysis_lutea.AAC.2